MILNRDQLNKRVNSPDNIVNKIEESKLVLPEIVIKDGLNHQGRNGGKALEEEERVAIGVLGKTVGNELAAELMGVSERTVSHLRTAQTTLVDDNGIRRYGKNEELQAKISERLESTKLTIQEKAAERLMKSLGLLSDEKLENCSAKEVAGIAAQVSQVFRNMNSSSSEKNSRTAGVRIILNPPKTAREESFDVIEVGISS